MKRVVLKIEGMTCSGCVRTVTKVLENMGAKEIDVSLERGEATFTISGDKSPKEFSNAVTAVGYPSKIVGERN
jgi:copper chaperone CopZ